MNALSTAPFITDLSAQIKNLNEQFYKAGEESKRHLDFQEANTEKYTEFAKTLEDLTRRLNELEVDSDYDDEVEEGEDKVQDLQR